MKRFAVYVTGHFRNLDETWPQYASIFVDTPQSTFDFYFTLWTVRNTDDPTPVREEDIRALCPRAKSVRLLPSNQTVELHGHEPPIAYQLYAIQEAFRDVPATYDWYVRIRTDLYFFDATFFDQILTSDPGIDLWISEKLWYTDANYPARDILNDFLWIGNHRISEYLASTYAALPTIEPSYMEHVLGRRLRHCPFPWKLGHFRCLFNLDRRTRGHDMYLIESQDLTRLRQERGSVRFNFQNPLQSKE